MSLRDLYVGSGENKVREGDLSRTHDMPRYKDV